MIAAPAVALLLMSRMSGEFADRGRKSAMMGGMALIALFDVGTALSNSLPSLLLARLGLGVGRGFAEAGERGMLTDLANQAPQLRGRALAMQQACIALGIAIGAPLGGAIVEEFGIRSAFLCVSGAAVVALGLYGLLPETVNRDEIENTKGSEMNRVVEVLATSENSNDDADWLQLLTTSPTWRSLALCQSGVSFGYACKIAAIPILATHYLPGGVTGAGLLLSAAGLAGLVGAPLGGFLTDKVGSRLSAGMAGMLSGVALLLVPLGLSLPDAEVGASLTSGLGGNAAASFVALVLLWSIGSSAGVPALTAMAQEHAPIGKEATALGLPRAAGDATYIIAPILLGSVSDAFSDVPGVACAVAGGALCVGSLALFMLSESDKPEESIL